MTKRIDAAAIAPIIGTLYPSPFDEPCRERARKKLGDAAGLNAIGVNLLHLPPGAWSSQRHWHTAEDEFVYVLSGEVTLVSDGGDELLGAPVMPQGCSRQATLTATVCRTAPTATPTSWKSARVLRGTPLTTDDIDMMAPAGGKPAVTTHRDVMRYPDIKRRGPGS